MKWFSTRERFFLLFELAHFDSIQFPYALCRTHVLGLVVQEFPRTSGCRRRDALSHTGMGSHDRLNFE